MTNKIFSMVDGKRIGIAPNLSTRLHRVDSVSILSRQSLLPILLLCLTLGVGQMWGADVEAYIFEESGGTSTSGWTFTNGTTTNSINQNGYWLLDAGNTKDYIITSAYDLSSYKTATVYADFRNYGNASNQSNLKVEISYDGGSTWGQTATSGATTSTYSTYSVALNQTLTNNVMIRLSNSRGGNTYKGVRVQNFKLKVTYAPVNHTVNWYVNGSLARTQTALQGTTLTEIPAPTASSCDGKKSFVGWTETSDYASETTAPTDLLTSTTGMTMPNADKNYYAVFANVSGGVVTVTPSCTNKTSTGYESIIWTAESTDGDTYTGHIKVYSTSSNPFQVNNGQTPTFYNDDPFSGAITKIKIIKASGTDRSWTPRLSASTKQNSSSASKGTDLTAKSVGTSGATWDIAASNDYRYLYLGLAGGATYISSIEITYGGTTNYATSCCTPLGSINGSINVTGVNEGSATASWTWNGATTGISKNVLKVYKSDNSLFKTIDNISGSATSQSISGLDLCNDYYVTLTTVAKSGYCDGTEQGKSKDFSVPGWGVFYDRGDETEGSLLSHVTKVTGDAQACLADDYVATFTANTGYKLPDDIVVYIAGGEATEGNENDYTWNQNTGTLTIFKTKIVEEVDVRIIGECVDPVIGTQSESASYQQGATPAALSVSATLASGTLTYLWKVSTDGGTVWGNASGTNNEATYAAANISTANTGTTKYKCIVGNQEGGCSVESSVITIEVTAPSKCLTPTFSVDANTYYADQSVELSCNTAGVTIYYTTNNTTPTTSSSVYSSAISVTQTTTIKAIAMKDGLLPSDMAEATYTIKCVTPTIVLAAGNYTGVQTTTITKGYGTKIYYTTDGSIPSNTNGTEYTEAVSIDEPMTLKAIVWKDGCTNSEVASAAYTLKCTTPTFNNGTGTYTGAQSITLSGTAGADIYYTLDGSAPSKTHGTKYTAAISVSTNQTVKALAVKEGWGDSEIASATYTIQYNVYWWVNGADWNDKGGSTLVTYGQTATAPTTAPTKANGCGDKFVGWTKTQNYESDDTAPTDMFTETSAAITGETNFYAVFADYGEDE